MVVKEKNLEIPKKFMEEEWQTNKIKIKKWTAGIKAKITDECMQMTVIPGQREVSKIPVQGAHFQLLMILHQVVEAPWRVGDLQEVSELDADLFEWLIDEVSLINESNQKNLDASEESFEAKPIQMLKKEK